MENSPSKDTLSKDTLSKEHLTPFQNSWNLWYHHEKDNWAISGYRKIHTINNLEDFWSLFNNWNKIGGVYSRQFFLMKNDIEPTWEDENNRNGGCWSLKVPIQIAFNIWERLSCFLMLEQVSNIKDDINGLSISVKKNNNCVIKIWNKSKENSDVLNLNEKIFGNKITTDIIYNINVPTSEN